ncbi:DUF4190 domain-containing protein [Dactylosporangium aurantiacum]|uniref:DUF4190 domain-containing protein n=1 Tax=Dactylosporangium aurantiacum TaxID=35754 RepID=A0A9Q9IFZ7_9ACTN|nr:DUF4190 domain-containing protein [Dactylosporangium aurantiacum]MDG6100552.1 DUF4190 domain-containing protein [Dactylosporangium aurantiacum]UWZ55352.1 DUF4190 domain-containing protein [Dactylosporangium aurantiacum]
MRYNKMAVAALVCAVLVPPFGILMGHIAWAQTTRTGERGRRLALAALVIGYVELLVLCGVPIVLLGF